MKFRLLLNFILYQFAIHRSKYIQCNSVCLCVYLSESLVNTFSLHWASISIYKFLTNNLQWNAEMYYFGNKLHNWCWQNRPMIYKIILHKHNDQQISRRNWQYQTKQMNFIVLLISHLERIKGFPPPCAPSPPAPTPAQLQWGSNRKTLC